LRIYPALDVAWTRRHDDDDTGRAIALLTDYGLSVVEETSTGLRAFFSSEQDRDGAGRALIAAEPTTVVTPLAVADEGWAERSQAALKPIRVDRIVVRPPWADVPDVVSDAAIVLTIQPSMGFGTGHHQSTRLCLGCLQRLSLTGRSMLDVGTGSGVLAIAAFRLGASPIVGVDTDADALTSAAENLDLNHATSAVQLRQLEADDRTAAPIAAGADVITANLSGALLERLAPQFRTWLAAGGTLIASGFQQHEESAVRAALERAGLRVTDQCQEDDWVAFTASPTLSTAS
jgi:ribosomal protein L11 methyltransferase